MLTLQTELKFDVRFTKITGCPTELSSLYNKTIADFGFGEHELILNSKHAILFWPMFAIGLKRQSQF